MLQKPPFGFRHTRLLTFIHHARVGRAEQWGHSGYLIVSIEPISHDVLSKGRWRSCCAMSFTMTGWATSALFRRFRTSIRASGLLCGAEASLSRVPIECAPGQLARKRRVFFQGPL